MNALNVQVSWNIMQINKVKNQHSLRLKTYTLKEMSETQQRMKRYQTKAPSLKIP